MAFIDPVAQTFFVDGRYYPKGFFIHSVDLCFKAKDGSTFLPITLQIRPTVNGYPHSNLVLPFAEVTITPERVNTTTSPNFTTQADYTRFTFAAPVFVDTGEYALVLQTNSDQYSVYVAEIGQKRLDGSDRLISKQTYAGSFFKSSNGSTYTAFQNTDMMFRINRCTFTVGTTSVVLDNVTPSANLYIDGFNLSSKDLVFKDTSIVYNYKQTTNASITIDAAYTQVVRDQNIDLDNRGVILTTANSFISKFDLTTSDDTVSPVVDLERVHLINWSNNINDASLKSADFTINNSGSGYTANAVVTITGSTGSSATATAVPTNGNITSIVVTAGGSDYLGSITATIADPTVPSGNTTATLSVANELASKGGNCLAKYITRGVVLTDGFDAGTLRAYISAVNMVDNEITLYYKVLANEDQDTFDSRPYVRMQCVQQGNETLLDTRKSSHKEDFLEYLYVPTTTDCSYVGVSNTVTYKTFKSFAIKIVMTSSNSTIVPKVTDMRAIALAP